MFVGKIQEFEIYDQTTAMIESNLQTECSTSVIPWPPMSDAKEVSALTFFVL